MAFNRREFLQTSGAGFGSVALKWMLHQESQGSPHPLVHHAAKAKQVIFLFMEGGPSHLDLLDRKPLLEKLS